MPVPRAWQFQQVRRSLRKISGMRLRDDEDTHDCRHDHIQAEPSTVLKEVPVMSREELETTVDLQDISGFFSKLPLEIRRLIYTEVWRDHLGARLRLHVHSSGDEKHMQYTPCLIDPEVPAYEDPWDIQPFPGGTTAQASGPDVPDYFWWSWCLRMRWGRHYQCQQAIMARWLEHGQPKRMGWSPFLPVFLSCKKMYMEAIQSFFETVTLCFTASEDAHYFLVQQPHPYNDSIRSLDFNFGHHKDHLFLVSIEAKHPRLARCSGVGVGLDAWSTLMDAVRHSIPDLRSLRILLGNRLHGQESRVLDVFGTWKPSYLSIEMPPHRTRYVVRHGQPTSTEGPVPLPLTPPSTGLAETQA